MKKQINPNVKAHLIRGTVYLLLLLAVCVIPFALAQRNLERVRHTGAQLHRPNSAAAVPADSVYQAWVARYNPPWNAEDDAKAIAVDAQGNVYVTGDSWGLGGNYDYATVKYNSVGQQQWVARYHGPDDGNDQANAMAIDATGNVYVTGSSENSDSYSDWATIKYNSAGQQQWVARHSVCPRSHAFAQAIAVDGSGNPYVTGVDGDGWGTIKYNSSGQEEWVAHYNFGTPAAIALDQVDNVYVTGGDTDYVTIKYDSAGHPQWLARYHGPGTGSDYAHAIAIDSSGKNIYVTGASAGSGTALDYATIKYNPVGQQQWVARYDGPAHSNDHAAAIGVDGSGDVYVTGDSVGLGTDYDYATVKYDSAGQEQWVARYNGPANDQDGATSLAVGKSGNVYVTGYSRRSLFNDGYATIKYNSVGQQQWLARYDDELDNFAQAIAVDGVENVYVTGRSLGSGTNYDYATIKYGQGPSPTPTPSPTASPTPTPTSTATVTPTPTSSATASPTPTVICSPTPTATSSPTATPSCELLNGLPCPSATPTATATETPTPRVQPTPRSRPTSPPRP